MKKIRAVMLALVLAITITFTIAGTFAAANEQGAVQEIYETAFVTARHGLNVRDGVGTNFNIHTTLPYGTEVRIIEPVDGNPDWTLILYDNQFKFVCNKYLSHSGQQVILREEFVQQEPIVTPVPTQTEALYAPAEFKRAGVIYWNNYRWTWYSERVLPGGGLRIPGRHTDELGYVKDENGYICLASNDLSKGTVVPTPFGADGKIYDCGCASGTLDVYVGW